MKVSPIAHTHICSLPSQKPSAAPSACAGQLLIHIQPQPYPSFAISSLNCHSGPTAIAQLNLSLIVLEKIFSMGTSFRLQNATEIRGSM